MCRSVRVTIVAVLALLTASTSAGADDANAVVWYRASDECPAGAAFLGKLGANAARAKLAQAGDHIDFLVTLVASPNETIGRLERQTLGGTVAIRELRDVSCERVADALALSLGLALEPSEPALAPSSKGSDQPAETAPPPSDSAEPALTVPSVASAPVSSISARQQRLSPVRAKEPLANEAPAIPHWSTGVDGGALFGLAPSPLAAIALFANGERFARDSAVSVRFSIIAAIGASSTPVGRVEQLLAAGDGELCPWRLGGTRLELRPCFGFELGMTGASDSRPSGRQARSIWLAPNLGPRGRFLLTRALGLEAGADLLFPLLQHDVFAGEQRLYRAKSEVFAVSLGISLGPF
jgi:hypothetical protein